MRPVHPGAQAWCFVCGTLIASLLSAPAVYSQDSLETPQQANERIRQLSSVAQKVQRDYVIGSGDLVSIEVFDVKELSRDVRVSETGTIALPLLPVRLHVAGLTEVQLEQKIAEVLEANGLVLRPQVSVSVKERKSKPITVIGAVARPMVYQAVRPVTLLEVLSEAGGVSNDAGSTVIIRRTVPKPSADPKGPPAAEAPAAETDSTGSVFPPPASSASQDPKPAGGEGAGQSASPAAPDLSGEQVTITIDLNNLLDTGDPKNNIPLEGGDVVMVPRGGIVYVIGAVDRPGGFVLSNDRQQMSALKVLSLAGGLRRTARSDHAVILRKDANGQQKQVDVNLRSILARKSEDVPLYASDILVVPESGGKRALLRAAEIGLGVGTAVTIFRVSR
jgi:polysaccharide export outer membrane protein